MVESDRSSFWCWLVTLLAIILTRNLLDGAIGEKSIEAPNAYFIDYVLPFVVIFLGILIVLRLVTRERTLSLFKVLTLLYVLILLVPVVDFIATSGAGAELGYVMGDREYITNAFITGHSGTSTPGQKVEGILLGLMLIGYIFLKTDSAIRAVVGGGLCYLVMFFTTTPLFWIYSFSALFFGAPFSLESSLAGAQSEQFFAYISSDVLSACFMLSSIALLALIFRASDRRLFSSVTSLFRPIRTAHYLLIGAFGILIGREIAGTLGYPFHDWIFSFTFLVAGFFLYQYASLTNDFFDRDYSYRTHAESGISMEGIKYAAAISLFLALVLTYPLNSEVLVIFSSIAALSFLYSAPPFRLKRLPIVAPFTLALCALLGILAGFAVFAGDVTIEFFPLGIALTVLVAYTLGVNYKDLKDVEADRKNKVYTIPVLFGERRGRIIIALLVFLSFLFVPLILDLPILWPPSIIVGPLSLTIIWKRLDERYFRVMHMAYLLVVAYCILAYLDNLFSIDAVLGMA